jgi:UDPglucose 6-dehydrogenase
VERNQQQGRLHFTTDVASAVSVAEVVFIAVGTPPDEDGSADLRHVLNVAETIGEHMTRELVVVTKSTVPVGTAAKVAAAVGKKARHPFHMCSNPEFLTEGAALDDFMKPDRVVLGVDSDHARSVMAELYAPFVRTGKPIIFMDIPSAEMTKYAANAMLATRISFMNEIANLCEKIGANVDLVRKGIGSDARIGPSFLFPGPGYGGSCFPKDVKALVRTAGEAGSRLNVLEAVEEANERQKHRLFEKLQCALGDAISGAHVAIWGLAFKPQTDDMREAPALTLIDDVLGAGATITAHDPAALHEARRRIGNRISYAESNYDALAGADALVVVTDWNEYRHPDFARIKAALRKPVLIDGRNLYDATKMRSLGFTYLSFGRGRDIA